MDEYDNEELGGCLKCGTELWQDESIRTGICSDCREDMTDQEDEESSFQSFCSGEY